MAVAISGASSGLRGSQGRRACPTDKKTAGRWRLRCGMCVRQRRTQRLIDPDQVAAAMAAMIVSMIVLVGKRRGVGYINQAFRLPSIHSMRIQGPGGRKTNQA